MLFFTLNKPEYPTNPKFLYIQKALKVLSFFFDFHERVQSNSGFYIFSDNDYRIVIKRF